MIGFYDYTVVLTFVSLLSTVFGMTQAMDGRFRTALICLAISGLCDTFDGRIAGARRTGPMMKSSMASSWIPCVMWCASACSRP